MNVAVEKEHIHVISLLDSTRKMKEDGVVGMNEEDEEDEDEGRETRSWNQREFNVDIVICNYRILRETPNELWETSIAKVFLTIISTCC